MAIEHETEQIDIINQKIPNQNPSKRAKNTEFCNDRHADFPNDFDNSSGVS
jgi:hypothetical protein